MSHSAYLGAETNKEAVSHDPNRAAIPNAHFVWSVARFHEVRDRIAGTLVSTEVRIVAIVGRAQFRRRCLLRGRGESDSRITHELDSHVPCGVVDDDSDWPLAHPVIERAVR